MSKTRGTAYGLGSGTKNLNPKYLHIPRSPRTTDKAFAIGTTWIDTLDNNVYFLVGFEAGIPLWRSIVSSGIDFKDSVLSIAVATNPPPSSNVGDRYIIDNSGAVNGAWGANVSNNDIVEFNGNSWDHDTPTEGSICYVEDIDILYVFNGTEWLDISNAIPSASETQRGVLRLATDAEAVASVVTDEALVPSNLVPVFSSPNPIGDTLPNTAGFTQIDLSAVTAPAHEPGRLFYDTDTGALTFYNSESDISLQIGEENWIKVRNESGGDLVNGTVVYLNGSSAGMPLVEEAIASEHSSSHAIAVVTHTIEDNTDGYVTSFGLVRNLNTNLFTGGEPIFLSTTVAGGITTTPPTNKDFIVRVGYIAAVGVSDGSFLVNIEHAGNIEFSHGYTNNPNGFLDPDTDVQISFVDGTRTFTIEPQGDSYSYWSEGIRYDKTAPEEIILPNTNGIHFIYYNGETLVTTQVFNIDIITKFSAVASVDWNVSEARNIYIGDEFKHTTKMGSLTHSYLHNTRGFALEDGGGLADIVADGTGNLDSDAQFGNEATVAWDEDARFSYLARTSTENIYIYYKEGPEGSFVWNNNESTNFGVLTTGTGRAAYNELSGGTWIQTEVPNNQFLLAHVFVYNDSVRKYGLVQGEETYTTITAARDGAVTEISNITLAGVIPQELKFLGTIIYQTSDVYGNTVKSRIRTTDGGFDYIDLREETIFAGGTGGTISDHGALSGLSDDDHLQYLLTDGSRTLTGPMDMGSQALTNVNIDSGTIDGTAIGSGTIDGVTIGTISPVTELQVDNININGNTISATDVDGAVIVDTGQIQPQSGAYDRAELLKHLKPIHYKNANVDAGNGALVHGITAVDNGYKGSVYSPTQKRIYFVPSTQSAQTNWHYYDCVTREVIAYAHGVVGAGSYYGGVYSPTQNRIYFVPETAYSDTNWIYIDCSDGSVVEYAHGTIGVTGSYRGGSYSPTQNRIYMAPDGAVSDATWIYIDCSDGSVVEYVKGVTSGGDWTGMVYCPSQNRIYFIPTSASSNANWFYIDCSDGSVVAYPRVVPVASFAYVGGAYSPTQNRIYMAPLFASPQTHWEYIDCDTGLVVPYTHGTTTGSNAYNGAVYIPTLNRIYFIPLAQADEATCVYIDCSDGSAVEYAPLPGAEGNAYIGGTYNPIQDEIIFCPYGQANNATWTYIQSFAQAEISPQISAHGLFNKF